MFGSCVLKPEFWASIEKWAKQLFCVSWYDNYRLILLEFGSFWVEFTKKE